MMAQTDSPLERARGLSPSQASIADLAHVIHADNGDVIATSIQQAAARGEVVPGTLLAIAAAVAGHPCSASTIGPLLRQSTHENLLLALVASCEDPRVDMLIEAATSGRLPPDGEIITAYLAATLLDGAEPPASLRTALRQQARRPMHPFRRVMLKEAARIVDDDNVLQVVGQSDPVPQFMIDIVTEQTEAARTRSPLAYLPEDEAPHAVTGFTARRAVKKVGRNEKCPCGSGKKYKRCCLEADQARKSDPSPVAGVTMSEYRARAPELMSHSEFACLAPEEMARFDVAEMSTDHLIAAYRAWSDAHLWDRAEAAVRELARRDDVPRVDPPDPDDPSGYFAELVHEALSCGAFERAAHYLKSLPPSDRRRELELDRWLLAPASDTVARLDAYARDGLADEEEESLLVDLAYTLLRHTPALGILVARGVVGAHREFDSVFVLEAVEEARDTLGLPPIDRADDIFDALITQRSEQLATKEEPNDALHGEADRRGPHSGNAKSNKKGSKDGQGRTPSHADSEELRRQLRQAKQRGEELERQLRKSRTQLAALPSAQADGGDDAPTARGPQQRANGAVSAPDTGAQTDAETHRLRQKITELKGLLAERYQDRKRLRQQLAEATRRAEKAQDEDRTAKTSSAHAASSNPTKQKSQSDADQGVEAPRFARPLIPQFSDSASRELHHLPRAVAAATLRLVAEIATGEASPAAALKRLDRTKDVWSARVGIHHRLLFRYHGHDGTLDILHVIARSALDTTLKRYSR